MTCFDMTSQDQAGFCVQCWTERLFDIANILVSVHSVIIWCCFKYRRSRKIILVYYLFILQKKHKQVNNSRWSFILYRVTRTCENAFNVFPPINLAKQNLELLIGVKILNWVVWRGSSITAYVKLHQATSLYGLTEKDDDQ